MVVLGCERMTNDPVMAEERYSRADLVQIYFLFLFV